MSESPEGGTTPVEVTPDQVKVDLPAHPDADRTEDQERPEEPPQAPQVVVTQPPAPDAQP